MIKLMFVFRRLQLPPVPVLLRLLPGRSDASDLHPSGVRPTLHHSWRAGDQADVHAQPGRGIFRRQVRGRGSQAEGGGV